MPVTLRRAWFGHELGEFRPCLHTYDEYPLDEQPELDLHGTFAWLGQPGARDDAGVAHLQTLDRLLAADRLALPDDFVTFYSDAERSYALDDASATGCWTDLSKSPIVSPIEPEARMVRFLRDQQDCVIWYLYLRPADSLVVHSAVDYGSLSEDDWSGYEPDEMEIVQCAASFEEFAYRFWLEGTIWIRLNGRDDQPLDQTMLAYLNHYRR
ncbi:hypothetical protein C1I95_23420 [Micromonospora craterilacus]|uniref:Uncharacterized protein n=2 Tax=Micromonospora craterilacus TaxID=1655439 RepID=A0A2W2E9Y4_9ACTN|nr:hypothetical protein C1I95_23420 [Micromonospora craterilacus]